MPFRLTNEGEYGVRLVVHLATLPEGQRQSARQVARLQDIPFHFLRTITTRLAKAGFIRSFKGKCGGLELTQRGRQATLLEIIEAIEGPIYLNICMLGDQICQFTATCAVHPVWHRALDSLRAVLGGVRIHELGYQSLQNTRKAIPLEMSKEVSV